MHVQTKREIQAVLAEAGIRPRKRFGQHFLIDGNLMRRLVEVAKVGPDDVVLEVGPGTGGLTDLLVELAGSVLCVEIDRDLFQILGRRFEAASNIKLICADALAGKNELNPEVAEALRRPGHKRPLKLVANLPYDVATPLLVNLLLEFPQMDVLCFTVQAEVADRIAAPHGSKIYGPLSILIQTVCTVAQVARLPPAAFWPRPQVDSTMLRLDRLKTPGVAPSQLRAFSQLLHNIFEHRRKTVRSALAFAVSQEVRDRVCGIVDPQLRPEQIDPAQWIKIFHAVERT